MRAWGFLGFIFVMLNLALGGTALTYFGLEETATFDNLNLEVTEIEAGGTWDLIRGAPGWVDTILEWVSWDYPVFEGDYAIVRVILFFAISAPVMFKLVVLFAQAAQGLLGQVTRGFG